MRPGGEGECTVAFPWTIVDKITPRPSDKIAADLATAGVYMTDRAIVNKSERCRPANLGVHLIKSGILYHAKQETYECKYRN